MKTVLDFASEALNHQEKSVLTYKSSKWPYIIRNIHETTQNLRN